MNETPNMMVFISAVRTDLASAQKALTLLPADFPPTAVLAASTLPDRETTLATLAGARVVIVRILGGRSYFRHGFEALAELAEQGVQILAISGEAQADPELDALSTIPVEELRQVFAYAFAGGADNIAQLYRYVAHVCLGTNIAFAPPADTPQWGFYHPDAEDRAICSRFDRETFMMYHGRVGRGRIGILFYRADWASGNLAHVDAVIRECERQGFDTLPIFVYSLRDCDRLGDLPLVYADAFIRDGNSVVDVIISMLSYAASDLTREERTVRSGGAAQRADIQLDVPIIQAVVTGQTIAAWGANEAGLGPFDAATKIVMPEFDGKIDGPVFAFRDPESALALAEPTQTTALVALAARYITLRRKPNADKRLVVMLTNFANRQGRIGGAVGLDTPASVVALLHELARDGYTVGEIPSDGDALMAALIDRGGYDTETLTEAQLQQSEASYAVEDGLRWNAEYPERIQQQLAAAWGAAPGTAYQHADAVYVAGMQIGNIFVMIQPPRGFGENPLAVYHSGELVPTHHYIGAYRWLREVFQADAIVQCGKHGTLEWLPGKSLGLSDACYPALGLGDLPLFYPFIVDDPGEGAQAKRRAHACIIDHLIPPMTKAQTYDELAKLQRLLGEYAAAERIDPEKAPFIADAIWESVVAADLQRDLGVEALPDAEEFGEFLQHIDGYLCELGDLQIRDGLHVLGTAPSGARLVDLALALVRLDAPDVPGVLHALADDLGLKYQDLADPAQGGVVYTGELPETLRSKLQAEFGPDTPITHRIIRQYVDALARAMMIMLLAEPRCLSIAQIVELHQLPVDGQFAQTLNFLEQRVIPDVRRSTDEMTNLLGGLNGRHVPPGPSGPPTRGMTNVLPTGRNFYSVDVRAVPSRFAWTVGVRLGDALLRSAQERDGVYPASIGMTVWGTSNMRTQGDDIAEILWLLGVRPIWHEENGRVIDLEAIALPELGRPRMDVTIRISGFFRDAFPNVVSLLDRAINLVANLDEPADLNYVRAATLKDEMQRRSLGAREDDARRRSRFRIFGNRPGSYGTGILSLLTDGAWQGERDLAEVYLASGSFAFSTQAYGEPAPAEFRARLAASTIAVQNQDNREHDIFDSDDYLQHHGGMIAAIRELTGKAPTGLLGDSSEPETPKVRSLAEEARRVFRARVVNPKWIAGARRHGYKGALEMAATIDYLYGYDATAQVVEDWMYERVAAAYLFDPENREFLAASNPWSAKEMAERLLEAAERGMWQAPNPQTLTRLQEEVLAFEGELEERMEQAYVRG